MADDKNWYVPLAPPINSTDSTIQTPTPEIGNNLDGFYTPIIPTEQNSSSCNCGSGETRSYCTCPYLKTNCLFSINQYDVFPYLTAEIFVLGNLFGDELPFDAENYNIYFYIYDVKNYLRIQGQGEVNKNKLVYKWKLFETQEPGDYYCIIKLIHKTNNTEIILPKSGSRFEIKIR